MWLTDTQRADLAPAEQALAGLPLPTRVVSNGEYLPPPQTAEQRAVEARLSAHADTLGARLRMDRRRFMQTSCGLAAAFLAMNEVFGAFFQVDAAEAADPQAGRARAAALAGEFVFDSQTHHVGANYRWPGPAHARAFAQGRNPQRTPWNPALGTVPPTLEHLRLEGYIKEVFLDSDTTVAVLSGFTADIKEREALSSDEIASSRNLINRLAGGQRVLAHGLFWPGYPGYLEEMDRLARELRIDSWKGYPMGDLTADSQYPWRLDDERVTYPALDRAVKHGIRNVCLHKGLFPPHLKHWQYASVDDVARAARDWPSLNFIIYHSALRAPLDVTAAAETFRTTGRIPWVTDLAEIPGKAGTSNVYAELGTTFASTVVTFPELAAAILGQLVKGMGADHVLWGTDSIWYGSPQWQIEAFRRFEIPEAMQRQHGFAPLGDATGPTKRRIFGLNGAALYGLTPSASRGVVPPDFRDRLGRIKAEYETEGGTRSNDYYGWVRRSA
ncbi:MAG TPA: amidohydrolase family protein [Methylomirabilota bacterium]|nr:amidohydrolase family protein [Methylomirabilota bacterium]